MMDDLGVGGFSLPWALPLPLRFEYPWLLALLLLAWPLYLWLWRRELGRPGLGYPSARIVQSSGARGSVWLLRLPLVLRLGTFAALVIALAGPQLIDHRGKRSSAGLDIMLVLDTSNSMLAMDFELEGERKNRLQVVKTVVESFIEKRRDDRIGLVIFGSEAYTQAPLTMDHQVLLEFMKPVAIGMAGPETAIGDALATAVKRLKDVEAKSKLVILLTDGSNTAGQIDPREASRVAQSYGIKVYTIGVGSNEPVPFPVRGFFGIEYRAQVIKMDEELMRFIAQETGGQYFQASNTEALQKVYDTIDQLEKTKKEWEEPRGHEEWAWPFLVLAALLLMGEAAWSLSRWRVLA